MSIISISKTLHNLPTKKLYDSVINEKFKGGTFIKITKVNIKLATSTYM